MAETSNSTDEQMPVPPGGGAAERLREFLAAREEPVSDAAEPTGSAEPAAEPAEEQDRERSENKPGHPTAG